MSGATPVAVVVVALIGAALVGALEQLVAGTRPSVRMAAGRLAASVREPLQRPQTYDAWLFHLAPGLLLLAAMTALATVPWTPAFRGIDLEAGVLFFAAALAYVTPAVFMAGWGAGRPLSVLAGFRFIALMLAYAMPISMVTTAVALPAESLRPAAIVDVQHAVPMALAQPLAAAVWLPAIMAVAFLPPFDVHIAPGEVGGGAFGGYRGIERAVVALSRRILVLAVSGMTAALLLGGWHGPLLPDAVWMVLKTAGVVAFIVWVGTRFPRMEVERLLTLAWKIAIPAALLAIIYAGPLTLLAYR